MSCCGGRRVQFRQTLTTPMPPPARTLINSATNTFEYVGRSALTVNGPVSRRMYRFDRPGARADVDPRDVASLSSVPMLRRVR
jgi:hypothetical protein